MISQAQALPQVSCFHASYQVLVDGKTHFLHVVARSDGDGTTEKKLVFLVDFYGWAVDSHEKIEEAKEKLGIK